MLGEDEELIAGRRPVEEAFVARRPAHRLLVVPQRRHALEKLVLHATSLRLPIIELEGGTLTALAGFDGHQGVALVVEPRRYATLDEILARAAERGEAPFVLALDSLEDPQNVGTLLRSAEAAGVHGVLFPTHRQAPLTPSAVKASAGAVEHLLLAPVDDLAGALADLRSHGLRIAGAEADAPLTARQSDLRGPIAIVVGSEGQGLGPAVRRRTDLLMRIPMRGAVGSLNAAVAGSILLFEAVAQRDPDGRDTRRGPASPVTEGPEPGEVGDSPGSAEQAPIPKRSRRQTAAETDPAPEAVGDELLPGEGTSSVTTRAARKPKAPPVGSKPAAKPKAAKRPASPAASPVAAGTSATEAAAAKVGKPRPSAGPKTTAKPAKAATTTTTGTPAGPTAKATPSPRPAGKAKASAEPKTTAKPRTPAKPRTAAKPKTAPDDTATAKGPHA